jgi:Trk K+ transport system NAD-binding subunit/Kef-type K+ transport system membrane component KefB
MEHIQTFLILLAGFAVIGLASKQIGQFFKQIHLPLISGFLFTGIIAGPFILGLIPHEAAEELRFIDEFSLGFIAFAAGSELYWQEIRNRLKSIAWITTGLVLCTFLLGTVAVLMLADFIPFMQNMPLASRIGVSILAAAILVARSPSSAIAIVNELRAKGPFTQMVLGVTVIMDVIVIILFAVNSSIASALLTNLSLDLGFILLLLLELFLSLMAGLAVAALLRFILSRRSNQLSKRVIILLLGYGIFVITGQISLLSHSYLPFELHLEALLICMVGSFVAANFTNYRTEYLKLLHDVGPLIYIAFFTLTGSSLELDVLLDTWPIALALFAVRLTGIYLGSLGGGVLAGEAMRYNRIRWMAFVTQAGVGLGLAREVAVAYPEWGPAFSTMIISVIVLNETTGPLFFKKVINMVGEAHTRAQTPQFDGVRDVIIFGLERQSLALAHLLDAHGWQVKIANQESSRLAEIAGVDAEINIQSISSLTLEMLHELKADRAEAIVMMLSDEENYQLCELIYEHCGTKNLVVRLHDRANFERFNELGARIMEPATAIVSLLDHFVRSPSGASLLLGMEENQDVIDIELRNPLLHGVTLRNLQLPLDTLVLSVHRDHQILISHGYTELKLGDQVTIVGTPKSLEEVMLKFEA